MRARLASGLLAIAAGVLFAGAGTAAPPPKVDYKEIPFDRLVVVERPSLARQIAAAEKLSLPNAGVDVAVHCIVEESGGRLRCNIRDYGKTPVSLFGAALMLAEGYRVQMVDQGELSDLDPTRKTVPTTDMTVHIGPAPDVDLTRQHPSLPPSAFTFTARPSGSDAQNYYPERAQRMNRGGTASVDCKVLVDLSLACPGPAREDPPDMGFGQAAQRVGLYFRSAPTMKDGQAAIGQWVTLQVAFRPPE